MSKSEERMNPAVHGAQIVPDGKEGKIEIPPKKYTIGVSVLDLKKDQMKLTGVENYSFKEIDGEVHRISDKGIEYPPISKEKFEELKKLHSEYFKEQKEDDDRNI